MTSQKGWALVLVAIYSLILIQCSGSRKMTFDYTQSNVIPPGGIKIGQNFYCDETEALNIHWAEYEYWVKRVHGPASPEYASILPDTTVWLNEDSCLYDYQYYYLRHPAFYSHPLVGISQEQAEAFSKWRSDRVFEAYLIKNKILDYNPDQNGEDHFTIERFFNGELSRPVDYNNVNFYPEYRLPTQADRKRILNYTDSIAKELQAVCKSKRCKTCKDSYLMIRAEIMPCLGDSLLQDPTVKIDNDCSQKNERIIFNLKGNVSEWLSDSDVAVGGSWKDIDERILLADTFHMSDPNAWTGFRNVCEWKKWK